MKALGVACLVYFAGVLGQTLHSDSPTEGRLLLATAVASGCSSSAPSGGSVSGGRDSHGVDPDPLTITRHTEPVPAPLESNFLVPNASFLIVAFLALIVLALLLGGVLLLLIRRRSAAPER